MGDSEKSINARHSSRLSLLLILAATLWLVIAIGVIVSPYFLVPVYANFDVELPVLTFILMHPLTATLFGVSAVGNFLFWIGYQLHTKTP